MKVLAIVEDLPHEKAPYSWGFVAEELREQSKYCQLEIIVTPLQALYFHKPTINREGINGLPYSGWLDGIRYYHPKFPVVPRYPYHWYDYSKALAVLVCILRHRIRFDLIHAHFAYRTGYIAGLVAKTLRKPMVLNVHGSDIHRNTQPDFQPSFWRQRTLKTLEMADRIIAHSKFMNQLLIELGQGSKTTMIPAGFVGRRFKLKDQILCRKRLDIPPDCQVLLYVGNFKQVKGTDLLPETLMHLCNIRHDILLLMIGGGDLEEELRLGFEERGLMKKVHFTGRLPNDQVGEYMKAADLLVVPSRQEGRGIVVIEALSCGLPVVGANVGGIPETLVNDSLGLLVNPEDPAALADAILKCLERNWDREYLHKYAQQFTWENLVPPIFQVYKEVLSRKT